MPWDFLGHLHAASTLQCMFSNERMGPPDLGGAVSGQRCPTRLGDNHTRRPFRAKSRELQPFPFAKDITNSWWRLDSVSGSGR